MAPSLRPCRPCLSRCHTRRRSGTPLVAWIAVTAVVALGAAVRGAPIIWSTPQTIFGDSDVATQGSLVYAYNVGTSTVTSSTVNGVTFAAFPFPATSGQTTVTVGSVTITESPNELVSYSILGSGTTPYSSLSSSYRTLLNSAGSAGLSTTLTVTLGGLTVGQDYLLQWWLSNAANIPPLGTVNATATNAVTLDSNVGDVAGGLGQFVIGTFTADASTQTFALTGNGGKQPAINAFQVQAVPEPSTIAMALAGLACGGWSMGRRRRRA